MNAPILRVIGLALSLAALGVVGWKVFEAAGALKDYFTTPSFLVAIAVASCLYAALGALLALGWHFLLGGAGVTHLSKWRTLTIFGKAQLLKYLPTNVLHFLGRHAEAFGEGASHRALIWASAAEIALTVAAAALIAATFASSLIANAAEQIGSNAWMGLAVVALVFAAFIATAAYLLRHPDASREGSGPLIRGSVIAFALYVLFFLANGYLLLGLALSLHEADIPTPSLLIGLVSLAWIAGFVIPGAPAGLGIRDLLLTLGLEQAGLGSVALAVALGYRITTLAGDILFAGFAFLRRPL